MAKKLIDHAKQTSRKELHWIAGKRLELEVHRIPIEHLYFNIENGRYADRMLRLQHENPGIDIDPRKDKWAGEIEKMLAGEYRETDQDKSAFERLIADIEQREQLRPGVVKTDGGVIDGNRRFAALRRLNRSNSKTGRFGYFEAVILPPETTDEDLWRIEAGLQLGKDERWDYSPVNELLKLQEGLRLYEKLIAQGKFPGKTAVQLVSQSIYGRSELDIEERAERLRLIGNYLTFIGKKDQYDIIGRTSERFLEANKILRAARNQQYDAKKIARLQAVLFYVIHTEKMDNWELRQIYVAMGGDPKGKGRKPIQNINALDTFIESFPEARELQSVLKKSPTPIANESAPAAKGSKDSKDNDGAARDGHKQSKADASADVNAKADVAIERFKGTMEATKGTKSPRQLVEGALAPLNALHDALRKKQVREHLVNDDKERDSVVTSLEAIGETHEECLTLLRPKAVAAVKKTVRK